MIFKVSVSQMHLQVPCVKYCYYLQAAACFPCLNDLDIQSTDVDANQCQPQLHDFEERTLIFDCAVVPNPLMAPEWQWCLWHQQPFSSLEESE